MENYLIVKHRNRKQSRFRKMVLRRDKNTCQKCGSKELIEAHHIRKISKGGTWNINNGVSLCELCHLKIHSKNKRSLKPPRKTADYYNKFYYRGQIQEHYFEWIKTDSKKCCMNWRRHIFHMIFELIEMKGKREEFEKHSNKYNLYNQ